MGRSYLAKFLAALIILCALAACEAARAQCSPSPGNRPDRGPAQPAQEPYKVLEWLEDTPPNLSIDSENCRTVVVLGNKLNLAGAILSLNRHPPARVQDVIIMARELLIGPNTTLDLDGYYTPGSSEMARAGDLFIVAEKIVLNGRMTNPDFLRSPWNLTRRGGIVGPVPSISDGRPGRVAIFANRVELERDYLTAKTEQLAVGGVANQPIAPTLLQVIARGFSSENPIQSLVKREEKLLWSELGPAFQAWISVEKASSLAVRELTLHTDVSSSLYPDKVESLSNAASAVPIELLKNWYVTIARATASRAKAQMLAQEYRGAATTIHDMKKFIANAPASVQASSDYLATIESLLSTEADLAGKSIVEVLEFPVQGAAPLTVTIVRDLANARIAVLPNLLVTTAIETDQGLRFGFVKEENNQIRLRMRAKLTVDTSTLKLVRERFGGALDVAIAADEIEFDSINLAWSNAQSTSSKILNGGQLDIEVLIPQSSFVENITLLAQPSGKSVRLGWRHKTIRNLSSPQFATVNFNLLRADASLMAVDGRIKNNFTNPVLLDYVIDGDEIVTAGFPARIEKGQLLPRQCRALLCYSPSSALMHVFPPQSFYQLFYPVQDSSIQTFRVENLLEFNPNKGGEFKTLQLSFTYKASPGALPQTSGPVLLDGRGRPNSTHQLSFIGPASGTLRVTGRAFWGKGNSYHDLREREVSPGQVLVDDQWLLKR